MAAKLSRLTHKIAMHLHLVAESCTICSSRSRQPVLKLLDTPSYVPTDYQRNTVIRKELQASNININIQNYRNNSLQHVQRMEDCRLSKQAGQYHP